MVKLYSKFQIRSPRIHITGDDAWVLLAVVEINWSGLGWTRTSEKTNHYRSSKSQLKRALISIKKTYFNTL